MWESESIIRCHFYRVSDGSPAELREEIWAVRRLSELHLQRRAGAGGLGGRTQRHQTEAQHHRYGIQGGHSKLNSFHIHANF